MNLKLIAPVRVVIDDTGGPFTGWPSIVAKDSADMTLIHRAGFKQEHWGNLTQVQAVQIANEIAKAINLYAGEGEAVAAVNVLKEAAQVHKEAAEVHLEEAKDHADAAGDNKEYLAKKSPWSK